MNRTSQKGMFKRTFGLFTNIRVPWYLYFFEALLGVVSTKVALMYIPYESELKLGNIEDSDVIWGYIGYLLLAQIIRVAVQIPRFYANAIVARNLQNKLINRSLRLPMKAFEKNASRLVSWITQDCTYADGLLTSIVGFITGIASAYMSLTSMSAIDKTLVSLVPVIVIYVCFSTWLEGKLMFIRQRLGRRAKAELTAYFAEHLGFITQVKQLHAEKEALVRGRNAIQQNYRLEVQTSLITLLNNVVSGSMSGVINILVFVFGVKKVRDGLMGMNELVMFQNYISLAYSNLSSLPRLYTNLMYYNGDLFYIGGLMAETEELYTRQRSMDIPDQDIRFENVSFGYEDKAVIKNVSFTIPKGKVTVVAGPNGSGKTTLFKLIERFYTPDSGRIHFGPYNAEEIHLGEWRQSITYVLQDPQLFNSTIRDNITYGMERKVSDEEVVSAAKLACADEFIRELPEGYDFVIGENGSKLSAGQRQRIAIARAVMLDPAYLLLDEATCNMDVYSENGVTEALFKLMEGRTTVMISHDMDMLARADHVIVLNQGVVEASGSRDEVEKSSPILRKLMEADGLEVRGEKAVRE